MSPRSVGRNGLLELLERLREHPAAAALIEPGSSSRRSRKMPRSTSSVTRSGCVCGIGQRQRRAPRAAEQLPAGDAQVRAQPLHVGDEVPGRVGFERWRAAASGRSRADRTERCDSAPDRGSGAWWSCSRRRGRRARSAPACPRVAALLEEDLVPPADLEAPLAIGLDRGIETEPLACRHVACCPVLARASLLAPMVTCGRPGKRKLRWPHPHVGLRFFSRSSRISRS